MTASLIAWGAIHMAAPDATLPTGVHGPVAAFGLDTLRRVMWVDPGVPR
jgi:hypothetical protein